MLGAFIGYVRRFRRLCSLTAAAKELETYKLDIMCVQDVRWTKGARKDQGINHGEMKYVEVC